MCVKPTNNKFKSVDDDTPKRYLQEKALQKDENNIERIIQSNIIFPIIK